MKISIEDISKLGKKATIDVDFDEYRIIKDEILRKAQSRISMPGFRKGKVPEGIILNRYSDDIEKDSKNKLIQDSISKISKDNNLKVAGISKIEIKDAKDNDKIVIIEFDVKPDISVPDYNTIKLDPEDIKVDNGEIDEFVDILRKQQASYTTVNRKIKNGDYVKLSYAGTIDGKSLDLYNQLPALYKKQSEAWEEATDKKSNFRIHEINSSLCGLNINEEKDIKVVFSKDFEVKGLQNKTAIYHIKINEIREVKLPALDDVFFKSIQVKDINELHTIAKERILKKKSYEYEDNQKRRIAEFFINATDVELPRSWIQDTTNRILQDMVNLFSSNGMSESEIEAKKDDMINRAKIIAKDRIKLNLCFGKIFKEEKLQLTTNDVLPVITQESKRFGISTTKMINNFKKNETIKEDLEMKAFQSKVINWIFEKLKSKNKTNKA